MKFFIHFFIICFLIFPGLASAAGVCSPDGYTIATINGVLTDDDHAKQNMYDLADKVGEVYKNQVINYRYLPNPSHIGGLGDFIIAAYQKFFDSETVQDYDLVEMWKAASTEIGTQKLLLVAHSQGNFYANSLYDVLADKEGGIPGQSLGVYAVATPASHVAGNGRWLTSETDHVIAGLVNFITRSIMSPNIRIEEVAGGIDPFSGHDFFNVYLKHKTVRIVSDIQASLDTLKGNDIQDAQKPCITSPKTTIIHQTEGLALAGLDFITNKIWYVVSSPVSIAQTAGTYLGNTAVTVAEAIKNAGSSLLALVYSVPVPPASSLIAGALPLVPAQTTPPSSVIDSTAPAQETPLITIPAPQTTIEIAIPSAQLPVGEVIVASTADITPAMTTSIMETIPVVTSTQEISTTSTTEIAVVIQPIFQGSGSVTGVSAEDLAKQAQVAQEASLLAQNTTTTTEQTATSTADVTTTTTEQTATSTADVTATSTADVPVTPAAEIAYDPNSVVINEIAWMGTKAQANDEWIELYNRTDAPVDLSGWTLESKNKSLSVVLAKTIPAHGYFLLERTASTTTDQQEDMTYTGALNNDGPDANIYLKNGTTTIDAVSFGYWPFGENPSANSGQARKTMERVSPYATSTLYYNWKTYSESVVTPFAKDANGNDIFGTPGAKNSTSGFYTPVGNVTENTTWYAKYSPYYIPTTIIVREGATLTIEPDVTVKFVKGAPYGGGINVYGVLQAQGTPDRPIIFTSFLDDASDGIDSNQDGSATAPAPGDWMNINFYNVQEQSSVAWAQIRYGGQGTNHNPNGWYPTHTGAVAAYGSSPEISDSVFLSNRAVSVYMKNGAHPVLLRNTISDTAVSTYQGVNPGGYGIQIADASSTADIIGNTFRSNTTAIVSESASDIPLAVRDNLFTDNARNGEFNGYANFNLENSGNSDTGHKGGFFVFLYVKDGQQKTLRADSMPYIVKGGIMVGVGGIVTIEQGAVLKSVPPVPITIHGTLKAQGTAERPVIFTSLADDSDGYDSNYSDTKPAPGDWQNIQFLGASSSDSVLDYATISYGGQGYNTCPWSSILCMEYPGAVVIENASPTISYSRFINNHAPDITVNGDSSPVFTDNNISL